MTKLTPEAVRKIAGPIDDGRLIAVIKTDATEEELIEAMEWLYSDDAIAKAGHHAPDSRVALLRDILSRRETATNEDQ